MDLSTLDSRTALSLLASGETTSVALTETYLESIEALNPELNAFITITGESALRQAAAADSSHAKGETLRPFHGVPVAIKDLLLTKDIRTTAGSRILENYIPPYSATAAQRLLDAGAVLLGKTNLDQFGMGSSSENSAYGPVHNPVLPGRVPGGSSGGSAAAVAAGLCCCALGTDTGGSVRLPASFTGTVGLKPTYGRVSRFGVVAFSSSMDQVGPMARTAWDTALVLETIAGHDPRDSTSAMNPVGHYCAAAEAGPESLRGIRLGLPREYFAEGIEPAVEQTVREAVRRLREAGASIVETSLPHTEYAVACYYLIATAEASSNLSRYDGIRYGHRASDAEDLMETYMQSRSEGFGTEVKRRVLLGTFALSAGYYDAYYLRAQRVRALIRNDFEKVFGEVDAIIAPTAPTVAFGLGEKTEDPIAMYLADILTASPSLAGIPSISVPCGSDPEGAPIGLQIMAPWFDEERILAVAGAWERLRDS